MSEFVFNGGANESLAHYWLKTAMWRYWWRKGVWGCVIEMPVWAWRADVVHSVANWAAMPEECRQEIIGLGHAYCWLSPGRRYIDVGAVVQQGESTATLGCEVKVSRSDFLSGYLDCSFHYNYLCTPRGLVSLDELPAHVGLFEQDGECLAGVRMKRRAERIEHPRMDVATVALECAQWSARRFAESVKIKAINPFRPDGTWFERNNPDDGVRAVELPLLGRADDAMIALRERPR